MRCNEFGQPIGDELINFCEGKLPSFKSIKGKEVTVEKLGMKHFEDLYEVYGPGSSVENFTYMPLNQFNNINEFSTFFKKLIASSDPYYLAIVDNSTIKAIGTFSLMRIDSKNRVVEMGWVVYSSLLKKSKKATEAQYLVMKYVFEELQYRRYEWKCDNLNSPSKKAAERLGFTFEGTFRQAVVYKNRNRDTNWYSILDKEWPSKKIKFEKWLNDDNFDQDGKQKVSLRAIE
jgi:RimJ/RimL family protein N-acetyltransferase